MNTYYYLLLLAFATALVAIICRLHFTIARRRLHSAGMIRAFMASLDFDGADAEENYCETPFLQLERGDRLLKRVSRLRSLHGDDKALHLTFSLPDIDLAESVTTLMSLEQGSELKLIKSFSSSGHTLLNVSYNGVPVGSMTMADESPLALLMHSGRVTGIYYTGFSGEELPMPSLVVYYVEKREPKRFAPSIALFPASSAAGLLFSQN